MPAVVVVEDDLHIRQAVARVLADMGHDVVSAGSALAGLEAVVQQRPDLVLLDEPESGVDLVNIELIGNAIRGLLEKNHHTKERKKSGLIITHSGYILDYVEADRGCVLVNKTIWCTGNPHEILEGIRERGYEGCLTCQR